MNQSPIIVLAGPTASGKTALALRLASEFPLEIISADSRQVYRGMDIGTAKPSAEEQAQTHHHLIDVVDPDQEFTAADFARLGRSAVEEIGKRGKLPLITGGTGLYIRTIIEGLAEAPPGDAELRRELLEIEGREGEGALHRRLQEVDSDLARRLFPRDLVRIVRALEVHRLCGRPLSALQREHAGGERPYSVLFLGLSPERDELYRRIDRRAEQMMADGLVAEVQGLLARGLSPDEKALGTIGYRETVLHLRGLLDRDETVARIQLNTRRYAKRQLTWFRKEKSMIWVDSSEESDRIRALIGNFMRDQRSGHG